MGICAGAYFGSSRCEFETHRPAYRVSGDRELRLSRAIARGSVCGGEFVYGIVSMNDPLLITTQAQSLVLRVLQ